MYQHALIIHSDYSIGKRIAFHKVCESTTDMKELRLLFSRLKSKFEHLTFGFHYLQTESSSVDSIPEYDSFFEDIQFYSDIDEFICLIEQDIIIKPIDVAKAILSKRECSHLELQKLIYLVYCEYLKLYEKDMFLNDFEALELGPVISDMYHSIKRYKDNKINKNKDKDVFPQIYSRLIKIPEYDKLIRAIDKTLEKYSDYTAMDLVYETHISGGPWDIIYNNGTGRSQIIPKELIKGCVLEYER